MKKSSRNIIIAAAVVVVLAVAMLLCWKLFGDRLTSAGEKTVMVEITHGDGSCVELELNTSAEYLWDAMYEGGHIDGIDGEFGKWVTEVDGESADESKGQYWMFTRDGAWVDTSCGDTPIADGEHYEFFIYVA